MGFLTKFCCLRDCIAQVVGINDVIMIIVQNKCYIVATCDRDLKRRIRKVRLFTPALKERFLLLHSGQYTLLLSLSLAEPDDGLGCYFITKGCFSGCKPETNYV